MRILVTGVSGQVGAAIVARMAGHGGLIAADRKLLDLSRPEEIGSTLDALKPDIIVNPAAYTAVDKAEDESELAFRVNATAPEFMASWAAGRNVPLIHFSTDYVFDGSGSKPWREDDPTGPINVYGDSKLAGECAIRASGAEHLIIRTSWVYASQGSNFLQTIARLAEERKELRVVADQVGSPTPARLLAEATSSLLTQPIDAFRHTLQRIGGLVHVSSSGETNWHNFAVAIVTGLKSRGRALKTERILPIASHEFPTKAARPHNSRLDLGRAYNDWGISSPHWSVSLDRELDALCA